MTNREETIVSAYIDKPLLINKKKFDMRMYVLVTSFYPLRVYLYNEGLARFATEEYSNDADHLRNKYVHLTNFSINKRNVKNYVRNDQKRPRNAGQNDENPEEEDSSKWSLQQLRKYLAKRIVPKVSKNNPKSRMVFTDLFEHCKDVIIKTLITVENPIVTEMNRVGNRQRCCFEIFGFDIMFDEAMKPWVLEVNCLPSLSSSSIFDKQVKT